MLTELPETDATGDIATIFAEIRQLYATPYVSSIHRHLATRPGVLEWAWELTAPAFRNGTAQETAWRIASTAALPPLAPIPRETLAIWGVTPEDIPKISAIAESFTRVAPLNLVFGGIVRDVLAGQPLGGRSPTVAAAWSPPAPLAPPPPLVTDAAASEPLRALLARFRSGTGGTAFVPGLYRMLAHWPGLLAHYAVELAPHFASKLKRDTAVDLLARIDDAVATLRGELAPARLPPPSAAEATHLQRMIDGYRITSPEMILFGRLIERSLRA
ncbi:MAG: hypothetical protein JSS20_02160 [Proteobacteria bacterium]|nr:hypothetical protein [Pseudomonadota bacterium]